MSRRDGPARGRPGPGFRPLGRCRRGLPRTAGIEHFVRGSAELLNGRAEALVRRGQAREAAAAAAEAAHLFQAAGRVVEAALAEYWLSAAQYQLENSVEAKALLQSLLGKVRAGLKVEPGFQLRLVMALSSNESRDGNHAAALAYLEEVRGLASGLDDRRRAMYLYDLAYSYRETGDFEAAVSSGIASLGLFRQANAEREAAGLGERSRALVSRPRQHIEGRRDGRQLAGHPREAERPVVAGPRSGHTGSDRPCPWCRR